IVTEQAGLRLGEAARSIADAAAEAGDRAADDEALDDPAEEAGRLDGRPVEREVVRLVEVELVLQDALREGEPRRREPSAGVDEPRSDDACEAEPDREGARDPLLPARRVGVPERRRDDVEPVRHRGPERRELEPPAADGPDGE